MQTKKLIKYLADYIDTEIERKYDLCLTDIPELRLWLEEGLDAFQDMENMRVTVSGGACPDCNDGTALLDTDSTLYNRFGGLIMVSKWSCPKCDYELYC